MRKELLARILLMAVITLAFPIEQPAQAKFQAESINEDFPTGFSLHNSKFEYGDEKISILKAETGKWVKNSKGWWYKNLDSSYPKSKWQKIGNNWYYFNRSGYMETGWTKVSGRWYYMNSSGAMQTGWAKVSGKWYYMNSSGVMQTGWVKSSGKWYHLNSNGTMNVNKWLGGKYYVGSDGAMYVNTITPDGYRVDSNGAWIPGSNSDSPINKPKKEYLPEGAYLKESKYSEHIYNYNKKLPDGGSISEVRLSSPDKIVYVLGKDSKGVSYIALYSSSELDIKYMRPRPEISSDAFNFIYNIAGDFAVAYSWQDIYKMVQINILYGDTIQFYASNTNSKTLGEELDALNNINESKFKFKYINGERILYSFDSFEANDKFEWIIISDSCENRVCTNNIDRIKLDKEKDFTIIYQSR